jgi:hypothetical protein
MNTIANLYLHQSYFTKNELRHSECGVIDSGIGGTTNLILLAVQEPEKKEDTSDIWVKISG